jgi:hypothetical protein
MSIRDPGDQYLYLVVETNGEQLLVLKRNRAIRFDAFWITEPVFGGGQAGLHIDPVRSPRGIVGRYDGRGAVDGSQRRFA